MEFEDMAFVLHLLRDGEDFLDVGANVGVYSILAASRGARVLAMEPVSDTYRQLLDNVHLNGFAARIDARNIGVGSEPGELRFSTHEGPTNHVLAPGESDTQAVAVAVDALDTIAAGWAPGLIKIAVEGFEANVIQVAQQILAQLPAGRADRAERPRCTVWLQRCRHPHSAAGMRLAAHAL
jgi:FkbM family methyltransferase